jgi:hypothetical protein
VADGKSFLALDASGQARWYYEPAAWAAASPAVVTAIIPYLLSAPARTASLADYRALPFKGQVGRSLQDRGLAITLQVSEDLESFEATTDIDITSPARPWLGTVTLSDDAVLDWAPPGTSTAALVPGPAARPENSTNGEGRPTHPAHAVPGYRRNPGIVPHPPNACRILRVQPFRPGRTSAGGRPGIRRRRRTHAGRVRRRDQADRRVLQGQQRQPDLI